MERLLRENYGDATDVGESGAPKSELQHALASLPVYRTYVDAVAGRVADEDRRAIAASEMNPEIAALLLLERKGPPGFVTRFQQTTPAIMAKGVEDTAFYRYVQTAGAQRRRR